VNTTAARPNHVRDRARHQREDSYHGVISTQAVTFKLVELNETSKRDARFDWYMIGRKKHATVPKTNES